MVAKIIMSKQRNYGRIDGLDLYIMWVLKNKIKINWPLFFCNRMIAYKNNGRKRLPYPSFVANVLRENRMFSGCTLLISPSEASGLDKKVVQKMPYVQDKNVHWYYDDKMDFGTWYYDFVIILEGTDPNLVEQMRLNMVNEERDLENDVEIEDVVDEDEEDDYDFDPDHDHSHVHIHDKNHKMVDLSVVIDGMRDLKMFMTQKLDAQDMQFQELN